MRRVYRCAILSFLLFSESTFGLQESQPATPLQDHSLGQFQAGLEHLARGDVRKASRAFGKMKPGGAGSLSRILTNLLDAYSKHERLMPNQVRARLGADRFLDSALSHARKGKVDDAQYTQALALIRDFLASGRSVPMARTLLCNLRTLRGDPAAESEPTGREPDAYPEKLFAPVGLSTMTAREKRVNGAVISKVVIDSEGCVASVEILKGLPHGLNESTIEALLWWSYEPARLDGQPVSAEAHVMMIYSVE